MNDTIDELKSRIADLESAIQRCCRNCWANDATDAAQCRLCGLKDALKGGDEKCEIHRGGVGEVAGKSV